MKSTFENEINKNDYLIYTCVGNSMNPLIYQDRDLVIIKKPYSRLKKYDVPLYRRKKGVYVLHRILKVRKKDYVICGDNRWSKEYGITDRHIIGVLEKVIRNGKEVNVTDWKYRLYVHLWCDLFPVRAFILRSHHILSKIRRRLGKLYEKQHRKTGRSK